MIKRMLDEFNYDIFVSKGLYDDDLTERYYIAIKNYKILLDKYLMDKLSLKKFDDKIVNSDLFFVPIQNENMDFYQSFSSIGLKYIYLRNNLYIDKLSNDDIDIIVNLSKEQLNNPDIELIGLIEKTYKDVLDGRPQEENIAINYKKYYGGDYWFNSDEIVFGIRYDEFTDNGLGDGLEWINNYDKQLEFLGKLMFEMNEICSQILGMKVNFLYYDDAIVARSMMR